MESPFEHPKLFQIYHEQNQCYLPTKNSSHPQAPIYVASVLPAFRPERIEVT